MNRKEKIHHLLNDAADEILAFIKESESEYSDDWMPAADIKNRLNLMLPAVPRQNKQYGPKGWLFATLMRILEDKSLVEFKKEENNRTFYRSL
jgi:hypothetical protein